MRVAQDIDLALGQAKHMMEVQRESPVDIEDVDRCAHERIEVINVAQRVSGEDQRRPPVA